MIDEGLCWKRRSFLLFFQIGSTKVYCRILYLYWSFNFPQADWINEECRPPETWPDKGVIEFERFDFRYRENLDLALRGIECEIKQGEKVSINMHVALRPVDLESRYE